MTKTAMASPPDRRETRDSEKASAFQVMRRTVGTDLQQHGATEDAQQMLSHESIQKACRGLATSTCRKTGQCCGNAQLTNLNHSRGSGADFC
jgi:hypothetical protein